jgi:hypothetical protein
MLMGVLRKFFQEVVVPELEQIRGESAEIKVTLRGTNKMQGRPADSTPVTIIVT